jgi:FixJ family two-component response regulator/anti-sigma regulatory factor (Ser/Thr protein kinase)
MERSSSVLIVDDEAMVRHLLAEALTEAGFRPVEAPDGEAALERARVVQPSVVLTDVRMPRMDGVELLARLKELDPDIVVAVMTGYGNEDIVIRALQNGAVNFFNKPLRPQDAVDFVRSALRASREPRVADLQIAGLESDVKRFSLITADVRLHPVIEQITLNLPAFLSSDEVVKIKIAIEEIIRNSVEHGNLGIGMEEKHEALAHGRFGELVEERLALAGNAEKKILVSSELDKETLTVTVEDEGEGFPWADFLRRGPSELLRLNGRGILLAQMGFDRIVYNDCGNRVTLEKALRKGAV